MDKKNHFIGAHISPKDYTLFSLYSKVYRIKKTEIIRESINEFVSSYSKEALIDHLVKRYQSNWIEEKKRCDLRNRDVTTAFIDFKNALTKELEKASIDTEVIKKIRSEIIG